MKLSSICSTICPQFLLDDWQIRCFFSEVPPPEKSGTDLFIAMASLSIVYFYGHGTTRYYGT
jgi:hypothetical protein